MTPCQLHPAWIEDASGEKHCRACGMPYRKWEPLKWLSPEEAARFVRRERISALAASALVIGLALWLIV